MPDTQSTIELSNVKDSISSSPVVYFCAEYAVDQKLPIYAGGLGILAGDVLGQANEDKRPFVAVGLMYHKGYLRQEISKDANMITSEQVDPASAGLQLLHDQGKPVLITLPIHARTVQIKIWVYLLGSVPLLLLDTDVQGNEAQDIGLCDQLYFGDKEHRFKQEMVLGIAGLRAIEKLGVTPRLFHLNEGHSALMLFELAHQLVQTGKKTSIQEALEHFDNVVFTNHTLVPAGNDVFSKDLVISYLSSFALEFPIDPSLLTKFGLIQDTSLFSPTMLALRLSTVSQGVSKLHTQKALEVWPDHPMVAVTNGVRAAYWQAEAIKNASSGESSNASLWAAHLEQKKKLIGYIKDTTGFSWEENTLIVAWARRLANYKRPLTLFEDIGRLEQLLHASPVPIRIVLSGKPHAHDQAAQDNLKHILEFVGKFEGKIVYLQNYDIETAKYILSGSDVLLNTPVRGFEACGTSGMKASQNGVLLCTTLDGWTDEVSWEGIGWSLQEGDGTSISTLVYDTLEKEVLPLFSKRDESGLPQEWIERMKKAITLGTGQYSAKRMLEELESLVYSRIQQQ